VRTLRIVYAQPKPKPKNEMTKHEPTSHAAMILNHLSSGRRITAIDALNKFHCFRLAARIADLRNEGWDIRTKMIETQGGSKVAEYRLAR